MNKIFIFLLVFVFECTAYSWGELGHETVAEIASRYMQPKTKNAIEALIGPEPLAVSSIWPDIVKSDNRFHDFNNYHYINIPAGKKFADLSIKERSAKDAMTIILKYPEILKSSHTSREEKMIALRYIIHVVGDLHQPLHVGFKEDKGGNTCQIIWKNPQTGFKQNLNLHVLWDETLIEHYASVKRKIIKKYYGYDLFATDLLNKNFFSQKEIESIKKSSPEIWLEEAANMRDTVVYPPNKNRYCNEKKLNTHDRPTLSKDYYNKAMPLIEKQILKGGYRLAVFLDNIFQDSKLVPAMPAEDILKNLQIINYPVQD